MCKRESCGASGGKVVGLLLQVTEVLPGLMSAILAGSAPVVVEAMSAPISSRQGLITASGACTRGS